MVFRHPQIFHWPFWALIVGWICANTPHVALFALLTWMEEARSFAHQERLSLEIACLLTGQSEGSTVNTAPKLPDPAPVPVIPTDIFAKKLDLAIEQTSEILPLALRPNTRATESFSPPDSLRATPPHEPPRLDAERS